MMNELSRRQFHRSFLAAGGTAAAFALLPQSLKADQATDLSKLRLASFRFKVTPPVGHSLCGGWIKPVVATDDDLEAIGLVLQGCGDPIVICAVDWTGLLNSAHVRWRQSLAEAAGTTPDRVAVQCVHQHNAPFACLDAQAIVAAEGDLPEIVNVKFFETCLDQAKAAVTESLKRLRPVTHVGWHQTKVQQVASNRRVSRNEAGRVMAMRGSSCRDEALRALPEGLIDPWAKTIAFYDGDQRIAACHYYATHPMSYYGDGRVSSDFVGLARKRLQTNEPDASHLYFTGCAGNVTAGKYNDGSPEMRQVLADRIHDPLLNNLQQMRPVAVERVAWSTVDMLPLPNPALSADAIQRQISDPTQSVVNRNRPAYQLAWLKRLQSGLPITISHLRINGVGMLHLPAESFVEYQLAAQEMFPGGFLATAAYGDGGSWYIPTASEYPHGGYEVSVAFSDPQIDTTMREAIAKVIA
jgi:hypothetical protein